MWKPCAGIHWAEPPTTVCSVTSWPWCKPVDSLWCPCIFTPAMPHRLESYGLDCGRCSSPYIFLPFLKSSSALSPFSSPGAKFCSLHHYIRGRQIKGQIRQIFGISPHAPSDCGQPWLYLSSVSYWLKITKAVSTIILPASYNFSEGPLLLITNH